MRILITGANGFIAREIIAKLSIYDHEIVACSHNQLLSSVPCVESFKVDFSKNLSSDFWLPYLKNIDVVINCVGIFQTIRLKDMWKIHYDAPKSLFAACEQIKTKKIIHISALGIDQVNVPYAQSKLAIEEYIQSLNLDSTILRPGLVYGKGAYGGSSFFRGLAGLPFVLPLPGTAQQIQQPIHIDDLCCMVIESLNWPGKQLLCAVGSEKLSVKDLLIKLRQWLGFKQARLIEIPQQLINLGAKFGNLFTNSPMSDTGIKMMSADNIATPLEEKILSETISFKPRSFTNGLKGMVSGVQDRWHSRIYFLRPILRLSIAFIWVFSGLISLIYENRALNLSLLTQAHIPDSLQLFCIYFFSGLDIALGLATFFSYKLRITGFLQCLLIAAYTLFISWALPEYWLHPFAPIAKNIPLITGILIMMALESDR